MSGYIRLAIVFIVLLSTTTVKAQYRSYYRNSSYHRHAIAIAQAQKQQMIGMLQSQVVSANQVLANAESRSSMSQSLAYEATSKLNQIRKEMESANSEVHNAFQELKMIEADILAGQSDQSEFVQATKAVKDSNQEVHRVFHKLTQTPEEEKISTDDSRIVEMSRLPELQRIKIKNDPDYKSAMDELASRELHVADVRKKLFEDRKEWKDAKRILDKARQESRSEIAKSKPASMAAAHQNQETQQLRNVIENAKFIIAQGELRLRQLGVKSMTSNYGKR